MVEHSQSLHLGLRIPTHGPQSSGLRFQVMCPATDVCVPTLMIARSVEERPTCGCVSERATLAQAAASHRHTDSTRGFHTHEVFKMSSVNSSTFSQSLIVSSKLGYAFHSFTLSRGEVSLARLRISATAESCLRTLVTAPQSRTLLQHTQPERRIVPQSVSEYEPRQHHAQPRRPSSAKARRPRRSHA